MKSVTAIIPSKLDRAPDGQLWVNKAIESVVNQTELVDKILVGVDSGAIIPSDISQCPWMRIICGPHGKRSHVSAMNACIEAAKSDLVAFLEDDDLWMPMRLKYGLDLLESDMNPLELVTMSQLEIKAVGGDINRINDFPTCSGWLIRREQLVNLGAFDDRFKIHWDNEFLGRFNQKLGRERRIHLCEKGGGTSGRDWLATVAHFSRVMEIPEESLLVHRVVHGDSVMGTCAKSKEWQQRSADEYAACRVFYGCNPW